MNKRMGLIMVILFVVCMSTSLQAATVFQDNFNNENGGSGKLNYISFINWNITDGTVDLLGNGFFNYLHKSDLYVDLDGSTYDAGILSTKTAFDAGTYTLQFDLAGNHRVLLGNKSDVVDISMGDWNTSVTLSRVDPLNTFTYILTTNGGVLTFSNQGGDCVGILLDNVELSTSAAPLPASILLLAPGLLGLIGLKKKLE